MEIMQDKMQFRKEFKITKSFDHPNIAKVHNIYQDVRMRNMKMEPGQPTEARKVDFMEM